MDEAVELQPKVNSNSDGGGLEAESNPAVPTPNGKNRDLVTDDTNKNQQGLIAEDPTRETGDGCHCASSKMPDKTKENKKRVEMESLTFCDNTPDNLTTKDPTNKRDSVFRRFVSREMNSVSQKKLKDSMFEFCQETSIHGLKQITEPRASLLRRCLWIVLLLLGVGLFGLQMVKAITYYYSWPVSININIRYNESIRFPAVTLCNQNAFKLQWTKYYGHYELISDLYSHHQDFEHRDKRDKVNLTAYPGAKRHHVTDLYMQAAHRKEDLLVGCLWEGMPCAEDDFVVTLTDFGVCYTFNSGVRGAAIKYATQTGSQAGLRLRLNIEQYEYMKGPNTGAGIKLHLHNQGDIALVKDHGIAVAPGAHAFVGVKLVEIHNLTPPHGSCHDDVTLKYYDHYTKATCMMDCLQRFVVGRCDCRDMYMPLANTTVPMCTLEQYLDCFLPAYEEFSLIKTSLCPCPTPCDITAYVPSVSYGSSSNFDVDALLNSNFSTLLQSNLISARDARQKVNKEIIQKDTILIKKFTEIVDQFIDFKTIWNETLDRAHVILTDVQREHFHRYQFHLNTGLENLNYVVKHEFVRGWEIVEERGIRFVAENFYDVLDTFDRFVEFANKSSPVVREAAWFSVENTLRGKRELALRAIDNITEVYAAFRYGKRLINYQPTISEGYDKAYAANIKLLTSSRAYEYRTGMVNNLRMYIDSLETLLSSGQTFLETESLDHTLLEKCKGQFLDSAKGFNYQSFRFSSRIVHGSVQEIQDKIDTFIDLWKKVDQACNDIKITLLDMRNLLNSSEFICNGLRNASLSLNAYLKRSDMLKTPAASVATSHLAPFVDSMQIHMRSLRINVRSLVAKWYRLHLALRDLWMNMIDEESLFPFYEMVQEDFSKYKTANTTEDKSKYLTLFHDMLRKLKTEPPLVSEADLLNFTEKELGMRINADIFGMSFVEKAYSLIETFDSIHHESNLITPLGTKDSILLKVVNELLREMEGYLEGNIIDADFYRENFLRLDIYLEDLSYEEIEQQEDYDIQKLLSDIGGSIGLFVGASALSLFEFFDVIMLHSLSNRL